MANCLKIGYVCMYKNAYIGNYTRCHKMLTAPHTPKSDENNSASDVNMSPIAKKADTV